MNPFYKRWLSALLRLRNTAIPRVDCIIAPLLKARLEPTTWLHKVILVVWHSGRAPKAWKSVLVIPLYKGKGSHQCKDNYRGINLLSIPSKVYALLLMHCLG
jgi:hypothetical protein